MSEIAKGKSPFYPGQPVPVELFVGRAPQIDRIIKRGFGQVEQGKPVSIYVEGEYGIGKSSIASFLQILAERDHNLHSIYVSLGGAKDVTDAAVAVLEGTLRSGAFSKTRSDRIKEWLNKYIDKVELFGFSLDVAKVRQDAPKLATPAGLIGFLSEVHKKLRDTGTNGIFLVLDEINGIAANPEFAHFLKGIVDSNGIAKEPLPLLLMLCGVEERRRSMIQNHQPIDRIFDVIDIESLSKQEMEQFFEKAFTSVQRKVEKDALDVLVRYSAGFPKIMHLLGDAAYWIDSDGVIDSSDAYQASVVAAEEVGKKYVEQQVYGALRSADYRSILQKIALMGPDVMEFRKSEVEKDLNTSERGKFNNFLQKMKKLNVLRSGSMQGTYVFNVKMVRMYIWMQSFAEPATK